MATSFEELERLVLPAAAQEAPAFSGLASYARQRRLPCPSLRRVLFGRFPEIVWDDPSKAWQAGATDPAPVGRRYGLGVFACSRVRSMIVLVTATSMRWVLQRPWAFLLGQMVFTKEAWEAERVSGSLAFELEQASRRAV